MNKTFVKKTILSFAIILNGNTSHAEDSPVSFGTIFVHDIEYDQSTEMKNLNDLTDMSKKQKAVEDFDRKIQSENESVKKNDIEREQDFKRAQEKLGVIKNHEMTQNVNYFLELRTFNQNSAQNITSYPEKTAGVRTYLNPGQIVKITDTPDEYLHKLRSDRANESVWKKLSVSGENKDPMYINYDWRLYDTITASEFPIELDLLVPQNRDTIPVFSKADAWTFKDCDLNGEICIDKVDHQTKAYLFDSTFVKLNQFRKSDEQYKLFYKIGYLVKDQKGDLRHKVGWIPGELAKRKITQLPKLLLSDRGPAGGTTFESDKERADRLSKYYIFERNINSENKNVSRWMKQTPGKSTEMFLQTVAFDGIAGVSYFNLKQSFLTETITQYGMSAGVGILAPIFVDLEVQGTFIYTVPITTTSTKYKAAHLFKGEQWLMYTTPWSINRIPVKFGLGGYYLTMFQKTEDVGFKALVGFQAKALVEDMGYWFDIRYGPTGQDFNFKFSNRELGASFGYRFDENLGAESWTLFFDYSDTNYISPLSSQQTNYQLIQTGLKKQF